MSIIVPRTCTEVSDTERKRTNESRPLDDFRSQSAYVLLGDPGAGKTTTFREECKVLADTHFITARDFLTLNVDSYPEWREKTLFIDGLDEVRAGKGDVRMPFDEIRRRLDALGKPRFRLSCREADWLGVNDREHLASVAPGGPVTVLRLDLLTDSDIIEILHAHIGIDDPQGFVVTAREQGVDELLKNPQSLELLVQAVANGGWPEGRLDTFEHACSQIISEHNEEHKLGTPPPKLNDLLDATGCLCAVQLIAGIAGYTVGPGEADEAYPPPDQCGYADLALLKPALATKLFKAKSDTRLSPVHRHIAEFLGARHLARLIDGGLPALRVIALITGDDGTVVTEMRGLSAWLAAQCQPARMELIARDPIGVGLYGDLRQFSHDEKYALLNTLKHAGDQPGSGLASHHWTAAFGPLATAKMEPALREILTDPARDEQQQMLVVFVLRILEQGPRLPGLATLLLNITRDDTQWQSVNALALDAFLHNCLDGQEKTDTLKRLLADIRAGQVSDPDNELLGTLLSRLYPEDIPASEVWNYLSEPGDSDLIGSYFLFWAHYLLEQSSDKDVCALLDGLQCPPSGLRPALKTVGLSLEGLPLKLLARGLNAYGDKITTERLYGWLGVGLPVIRYREHEASRNVRAWLEPRPEIQKALIVEGIQRCVGSDDSHFSAAMYEVEQRLYGSNLPPDFGVWCMEQARAATAIRVVKCFIVLASHAGLPLESQLEQAHGHAELQAHLSEMIMQRDRAEAKIRELRREEQSYTEERERQEDEWFAHVRTNEAALRENRAAPALLFKLAKEYFGCFHKNEGPEAIKKLLRSDQSLVDVAFQGLRGVIDRKDVPDVEKILGLRAKGKIHYLCWPFLAGLAELERTVPEDASLWDNGRIRRAVAFYYCTPHGGYRPKWYQRLLTTRPELVANVQIQFARLQFRHGQESIYKLRELAHDTDHAVVAQYASLPLLRAFPVRCKLKQLRDLDNLLWAAIQHADRASFEELIATKLSRTSMNQAQRVHWLVAGLVVSPAIYRERLSDFVRGREKQATQAAAFFCDSEWKSRYELGIPVPLEIPTVELLIRLIGSYVGPDLRGKEGVVSPAMEASRQVHTYIQHLATSPAQDASDALASLYADPALECWHGELSGVQDSQRVIRRDAEYRHPDIEQVCATLQNGPPANVADLAALVTDRLREITERIRTGNTNAWRQYWNEDSHGRPQEPKHENSCRDALLSALRERLACSVDAQPEGQYANNTRADIRVSCAGFNLPVEIKKSSHPKLWSAMKNQLIAQYTRDPDASGYGIYTVFWFGQERCQPGPSGCPKSAAELEERLCDMLSPDEARMISVCVIDVAKPFASALRRSG